MDLNIVNCTSLTSSLLSTYTTEELLDDGDQLGTAMQLEPEHDWTFIFTYVHIITKLESKKIAKWYKHIERMYSHSFTRVCYLWCNRPEMNEWKRLHILRTYLAWVLHVRRPPTFCVQACPRPLCGFFLAVCILKFCHHISMDVCKHVHVLLLIICHISVRTYLS